MHGNGLGMWTEVVSVTWSCMEAGICSSILSDRRKSAIKIFSKYTPWSLREAGHSTVWRTVWQVLEGDTPGSVSEEVKCPLIHSRGFTR